MEKAAKGSDYLSLALLAFAGFAFELLLAYCIEPAMGLSIETLDTGQSIVHWLVTSAVWLLVGILLIRYAKNKYGFDIWEPRAKLKAWQYVACIVCIAVMVSLHYLDWGGFKPAIELARHRSLEFVFQYVYYFFEAFLFSLIIVFGQKACEVWFHKPDIPYGGIVVALTWGLGHILSKGSIAVALGSALGGFLFGAAYLIVGRDYRLTLPLLFIMFVM